MIPVIILTGYLGSGKTTLLSHLLRQPDLSRTAVVINEFGEIGLDHELVSGSTETLIELSTGCLCCKVRGDLVETLSDLVRRRDAGSIMAFDRIVVETSGMADPAPILQALMTDAELAARFRLGGVVATVDALGGVATMVREPISRKQVALADRLVLTKTDLVDDAAVARVRQAVEALNPAITPLVADHGRIAPDLLLADRSWQPLSRGEAVLEWLRAESAGEAPDRHDVEVATFTLLRESPISAVALTLFLEALAEHSGSGLLRLKGIVAVAEHPERPAVLHGVQHVFHPPEWLDRWPSDDRRTRIVLITRGISKGWADALLAAIEAEVAEAEVSKTTL
jgi:G3E family GTPase